MQNNEIETAIEEAKQIAYSNHKDDRALALAFLSGKYQGILELIGMMYPETKEYIIKLLKY